MRNLRVAALGYAAGLLLLTGAGAAAAQTTAKLADTAAAQTADTGATQMKVEEQQPLAQDTPTPVPTAPPSATATATATPTPPPGAPTATPVPTNQPPINNAARRGPGKEQQQAKAWEAEHRCLTNPSLLLAHGGTAATTPPRRSFAWLAYVIAGTCLLLVAAGALIRWYRARRPGPGGNERFGLLEVVATVIGICAGITGLLSWAAPDLVARAKPAKQAEMTVQTVNTRIRHDNFVQSEDPKTPLKGLDRREVGNVIWLNLHVVGYKDTELQLQWGEFNQRALIAATTGYTTFKPPTDDVVQFLPVWVGYPNVKFQVELRLMLADTQQVIQMAKTEDMNGTLPRYACQRT